jgi:hypothetical protein
MSRDVIVIEPDPDPKPRANPRRRKPRRKPRRERSERMPTVLTRPDWEREPAPMPAIDRATGGALMQGRKTLIGIAGLALVSLCQTWGLIDNPAIIATSQTVFATLAGLGIAAKIERAKA